MPLFRVFCILFFALALNVSAAASVLERQVLNIGIAVNAPPWVAGNFIRDTARYLQWKLPQFSFKTQFLSSTEIRDQVKKKKLDFVICSPLLLGSINEPSMRVLATIVSRGEKDPDRATGGAVLVKKDSSYKSLRDLEGKSVAATTANDFSSYIPVQAEIAKLQKDPDKFFSRVSFEGITEARRAVKKLTRGEVEAAIVRANYLSDKKIADGEDLSEDFRILPASAEERSFVATGSLYPNEIIAAAPTAPNNAVREILGVLLSKPINGWGQHWSVAPDMSSVEVLLELLKLGKFEYLRYWSFKRVWDESRWVIIAGCFLILFLILHGTLAELLVRQRTKQLQYALKRQKEIQVKLYKQTEKVENLERSGIVGQLSTLVAHEMKHHLAGIIHMNYALRKKIEDFAIEQGNPDFLFEIDEHLEEVDKQAKKANVIIEHVRNYARRKEVKTEKLDLSVLAREICNDFCLVRNWHHPLTFQSSGDCSMKAKKVELEIILLNLLKNASEAALLTSNPLISVSIRRQPQNLVLIVENNGVPLSKERLKNIQQFSASSSKESGLGLGLGIIQTLAESMLAKIDVRERRGGGIFFEIKFPVQNNQ